MVVTESISLRRARNGLAVSVFKLLARVRGRAISEAAMPVAHDLHPDFGLLSPTKRLRRKMRIAVGCVLLALVAVAVLRASHSPPRTLTSAPVEPEVADAVTDSGQAPEALLAAPSSTEAAKPGAGNTNCELDNSAHRTWAYFEGRCGADRAHKPLRAPTDRPPLAGISLGRTPSPPPSTPALAPIPPIIAVERQAEPSTSAATMPTQADAVTEPSHRRSATVSKKPQKTTRRENRRRDPAWRDAPWGREVRAAEWGARAYGGGERDYGRGGYVREGFFGYTR
jgi:hypothetical protein